MKINKLQSIIALVVFSLFLSCSNNDKKETSKETKKSEYVYSQEGTQLEWTAYKTSDKLPVKGTFKKYTVNNTSPSKVIEELISSTSFEIETNSVYTGNDMRDNLLKEFFFGVMLNTDKITGSFKNVKDGKGTVVLKLNDVEYENPFTYKVQEETLIITTNMQLANWNGQKAVESINEKCLLMHKGPDGVSKTWSEVDVLIKTKVN